MARTVRPRLRCELLEDRLTPAGIYIENFSDDSDPTQYGLDTFPPDGFLISNNLVPISAPGFPDYYYISPHLQAYAQLIARNDPQVMENPDYELFLSVASFSQPVVFTFPTPGAGTGLFPGEQIAAAAVNVRGTGTVRVVGAAGSSSSRSTARTPTPASSSPTTTRSLRPRSWKGSYPCRWPPTQGRRCTSMT